MSGSVCASCGREKHVNASTVCQDFSWHTPGIKESKLDPVIEKTAKVIDPPGLVEAPPFAPPKPQVTETTFANSETVLEEAATLIYGDRLAQYGNAKENFSDIADLWEPIIGKNVGPEAVALCLLQLKVARAIRDVREGRPIKRDTVVDLAGYAGCIEKIQKGV